MYPDTAVRPRPPFLGMTMLRLLVNVVEGVSGHQDLVQLMCLEFEGDDAVGDEVPIEDLS